MKYSKSATRKTQPKVHFAVVCKVIACNIRRLARGIAGTNGSPSGRREVIFALKYLIQASENAILAFANKKTQKTPVSHMVLFVA